MKNINLLLTFVTCAIIKCNLLLAQDFSGTHFRNGDPIPYVESDAEWESAGENKQPAWCYYNNDPANGPIYGKLYNWYAVSDPRGLCPAGWHVPSDEEWTMLTNALGGEDEAANKMKSKSGWAEAGNGTNSSGFSGLPGGGRNFNGAYFYDVGYYGHWWNSTEYDTSSVHSRALNYIDGISSRTLSLEKNSGYSVRCLRD